jgi:prophage tail gpP-like protein
MDKLHSLFVKIGEYQIADWESFSIEKSLSTLCGKFEFKMSSALFEKNINFYDGDKIEIYINETIFMTGYIENFEISLTEMEYQISISGREKTCDIVDCNNILDKNVWYNQSLWTIANYLCNPFDINVLTNLPEVKIAYAAIEDSETIFDFLLKLAKQQNVRLNTSPYGNIEIVNTVNEITYKLIPEFMIGNKILIHYFDLSEVTNAKINGNLEDRFSQYVCKTQFTNNSGDAWNKASVFINKKATDENIFRYRTKVFSESNMNANQCQKYANWEAQNRAAKSTKFTFSYPAWTKNGQFISMGDLINFDGKKTNLSSIMIVDTICYKLESDSYSISVSLLDKMLFNANPKDLIPEKQKENDSDVW